MYSFPKKGVVFSSFDSNCIETRSVRFNQSAMSERGLVPHRRHVVTWTNGVPVHWHIYASLGLQELIDIASQNHVLEHCLWAIIYMRRMPRAYGFEKYWFVFNLPVLTKLTRAWIQRWWRCPFCAKPCVTSTMYMICIFPGNVLHVDRKIASQNYIFWIMTTSPSNL